MIRKSLFIIFIFFSSCLKDSQDKVNLHYFHFTDYLFETKIENIVERRKKWETELGSFSAIFNNYIIQKKSNDEDKFNSQIIDFINVLEFKEARDSINTKFSDFNEFENQINNAFSMYHKYFPDKKLPKIITLFTGFNYGISTHDSVLAIGLEWFLGKNSKFYYHLNDPTYIKFQKQSRFMLPSIMEAWFNHEFLIFDRGNSLLSKMIYKGKIMYFIDKVLPEISFHDKFRYSKEELEWCYNNESQIWTFLIENDFLFSTKENDYRSYLNLSPYAKGMHRNAPSRVGYFVGYNIVNNYMKNNPQITIKELILETDEHTILNRSRYKPNN